MRTIEAWEGCRRCKREFHERGLDFKAARILHETWSESEARAAVAEVLAPFHERGHRDEDGDG